MDSNLYDVAVLGAGHAGCEAALAAARMGCRTVLLTMNLDTVALMPCNPSIGGPAKGHVVREIDALGGEMARCTDRTFIQIRMLNTGKGPAVQVPRAQADKKLYMLEMKRTLERQPNLHLKQATVRAMEHIPSPRTDVWQHDIFRLRTPTGLYYDAKTIVLTTGTSLQGRIITGDATQAASRAGEPPALGISDVLRAWGLTLGRLKTGTPPRVDARTVDFSKTEFQPGSTSPLYFGFYEPGREPSPWLLERNPVYPLPPGPEWRPQLPCYLVHTNARTHAVILANLNRAPMFNGTIQGRGPRYCPSIEDKIHRFRDKPAHGLFLEPEGWETTEVYVQGANTSLPEDVQLAMLRTIPALERAEMMRVGYAVEYDFVPPSQTRSSLECKTVPSLFFAGQINGTSGYEEAAGQGLMAGINAALKAMGKAPLVLRRDQAYIGVMVDDLVTRELEEPYRLLTARAEYRLLLRQDNADLRLTPIARDLGLVSRERAEAVERKREAVERELHRLEHCYVNPGERADAVLRQLGLENGAKNVSALDFLRRQGASYRHLVALSIGDASLDAGVVEQIDVLGAYQGYIEKQQREVERVKRLEHWAIPTDFDYATVTGLRTEAREKLRRFQPATVGQATRIMGVNPADISLLLVHLERHARATPVAT
ncbi:MAG: tRNA uridine-5-carboxymethylaminomethyl(34) synthesis enzyme MnmG [Chloroflexi bacterium]|nr:tRNA uridine-5-carboxymethylaminomethyl(34) synthesis enzyme MnmG [Chloroflexota bacterium]